MNFDWNTWASEQRIEFPILKEQIYGKPLVYLDNAATTQKPQCVIDAMSHYYLHDNANVHRGVHALSERSTLAYENARRVIQQFIGAKSHKEIIFVRGTTEGINLVAQSYGRLALKANDEIVLTELEHHSNIVPWQLIAEQTGAIIRVIPIHDNGALNLDIAQQLINEKTKILAVGHISNALGSINPIKKLIEWAHAVNAKVLIDGAQAIAHMPMDVQALDCDFYLFSGHKMYGPTGIGVLYAKEALLEVMPPYQGGGDMIATVSFEKTVYNQLPYKFEAGTPAIAEALGLAVATQFIQALGWEHIQAHEKSLLAYATPMVAAIPELSILGTTSEKAGIISFVLDHIHPHDIGTIVDRSGVALRVGHHCAMPLMQRLGVPATVRISLALYNTQADIDQCVAAIHDVRRFFKRVAS